jgi:hypothetical protein
MAFANPDTRVIRNFRVRLFFTSTLSKERWGLNGFAAFTNYKREVESKPIKRTSEFPRSPRRAPNNQV